MSEPTSLLPPNALPSERALELAIAARLEAIPSPLRDLWNPDACPVELLPWLAWRWSVDRWSNEWSETQKRAAIKAARAVHEQKGTPQSIRDVVEALGYTIEFREWWESGGEPFGVIVPMSLDPHEFLARVDLAGGGITAEGQRTLLQAIEATKPLRSHMRELVVVTADVEDTLWMGAAPYDGDYTELDVDVESSIDLGYFGYDGFLVSYDADDLAGANGSSVTTWSPNLAGGVDQPLGSGSGITLRTTDGPLGTKCVRVSSGQILAHADLRAALVAAGEATIYAVIRTDPSDTSVKGWQLSGTSGLDDHWLITDNRIYSDFLGDARLGPVFTSPRDQTLWHVAAFRRIGGTVSVWWNGTKLYEGAVGSFSVRNPMYALWTYEGIQYCAEWAAFDVGHDDATVAEVSAARMALHGIT